MAPRKPIPAPVKCGATARHSGEPCRRWAIPGSSRCKHHGGLGHPGGRRAAEDLHAARRIEALVTGMASEAMLAVGWSPEVIATAGGSLPTIRPDEESRPSADLIAEEDEQAAIQGSIVRMAMGLASRFQEVAATAPAPAPALPVLDGEVVDPDPVAEDIRRLEARPTPKRQARAAELRAVREHGQHVLDTSQSAGHLDPAPEPEPEPRSRPGRTTTTLGTGPGGRINYGGPR